MKLDCYAVLGLSPAAEDVVIRAAYLALMRSYHPDRNGSAEAAARARAITEAYKTIGDPARRAAYDDSRRANQYDLLGYDEEPGPARRLWPKLPVIPWPKAPVIHWPKARAIGAVAASALAIVLAVTVLPLIQSGRADMALRPTTEPSTDKAVGSKEPVAAPARRTEEERPAEPVAPVPSRPVEASPPPETAPPTAPEPARAMASKSVAAKVEVAPKPRRTAEQSSPPQAAARPARTKMPSVDEKARIAALEGMSTSFYNQSVSHADDARRSQLQQARGLFVNARNACRSDSCVGDAHASYIRDISRIMNKAE